jgi:hypothetical protein
MRSCLGKADFMMEPVPEGMEGCQRRLMAEARRRDADEQGPPGGLSKAGAAAVSPEEACFALLKPESLLACIHGGDDPARVDQARVIKPSQLFLKAEASQDKRFLERHASLRKAHGWEAYGQRSVQ